MEVMSFKPITTGSEVYSESFSQKGWFIVDQVDLRPNNSVTDPKLVAIIKAHLREKPDFRVEATSDRFSFSLDYYRENEIGYKNGYERLLKVSK